MNDSHFDQGSATYDGPRRSRGRRPDHRRGRGRGRGRGRRHYDQQQQQQEIEMPDLTVPEDKTVLIGLTGEPGSGKSALAQVFVELGGTLVDVDAAGHDAIEGPATKKKLLEAFGDDIIEEDGKKIDRAKLAAKAFVDTDSVALLTKLFTPN